MSSSECDLSEVSVTRAVTNHSAALHTRVRAFPELLAPAGDWECARAAVENGADAIYFGLERFNARMRAHNFTEADLPQLMEFLHSRGVKGYVTFNTLIFANELAEAEQYIRTIIAAGVDAAIVQDVGICRLIRKFSPDFPLHASTQMTITSAGGIEFAEELGCNLVVLARECSLKEIAKIQQAQGVASSESPAGDDLSLPPYRASLPLEVFVHGALCVAYSGQCLTSEALGGRSANRGECAQACRMPYELVSDGSTIPLGDKRYLLSPQDLAGLEVLPELIRAGVASLKIEGRLKSPEYVANITRVYRRALDQWASQFADTPGGPGASGHSHPVQIRYPGNAELHSAVAQNCILQGVSRSDASRPAPSPADCKSAIQQSATLRYEAGLSSASVAGGGVEIRQGRPAEGSSSPAGRAMLKQIATASRYDLEMAFSRGLHTGWFRGNNNQQLVHARFGKKRGVYLGEVSRIEREAIAIRLQDRLKPGDGVVFDAGHPDLKEEGGRVYQVQTHGAETWIQFGRGDVDFRRIQVGDKLWKTSDPELDRRLRQTFTGTQPHFQRPLTFEVHGRAGIPMILLGRDELGNVVQAVSAVPLAKAETQPLTSERLREQLGRLGRTPFQFGPLQNHLEGEVILPMKEINRLRREVVAQLEILRARPKKWTLNLGEDSSRALTAPHIQAESVSNSRGGGVPSNHERPGSTDLIVLVRNLPQLEAALSCHIQTLYCEFEDPKKYREAVQRVREWPKRADIALLASPQDQPRVENREPKVEVFVAPPRIFKMGEEWILKQVRSCEADGYLVRNYDHLKFFAEARRIGDFSLNVANPLTADYFKVHFGLERLTASYDLNFTQLEALLRSAPPEWFEITVHQHMPMFHMEHCVFCAFLSAGTDYTNCGRPCDKHEVKLRDRTGAEHPLKADIGCRNTVFNALAQTGAEYMKRFLALGVRTFRVEFLNESPAQVKETIEQYRKLLKGEISGAQLWRELKLLNQLGVTRGPMA